MLRVAAIVIPLVLLLSGCRQDKEAEKEPRKSVLDKSETDALAVVRDWAPVFGIAIPVLALAYAAIRLRSAIEARNTMKIAELAVAAESPEEAADRLRLGAAMMGKLLPINLETSVQKLVAERINRSRLNTEMFERRKALIQMLAEFPDRRSQILADWETCFGDADSWALHISRPPAPDESPGTRRSAS